jgi:hypothetical protein
MNFQWSEAMIARAIALQTLARKCVVLVDNCGWTGHECDVLGVTTDLRIIDVEVKISRADLKADAKKEKWWHRLTWQEKDAAGLAPGSPEWWSAGHRIEHPHKVWKHYYALPAEIWREDLFAALPSTASGVLLLREPRNRRDPQVIVQCIRRATPARDAHKLTPAQVMDIARLANLRMWEAYNRRDQALREVVA